MIQILLFLGKIEILKALTLLLLMIIMITILFVITMNDWTETLWRIREVI